VLFCDYVRTTVFTFENEESLTTDSKSKARQPDCKLVYHSTMYGITYGTDCIINGSSNTYSSITTIYVSILCTV
jgi:hypothetical protein